MRTYTAITALGLALGGLGSTAQAAILFQQDFNGSTNLNDYISATPNIGQFTDTFNRTTGTNQILIEDGALRVDRNPSGSQLGFTRLGLAETAPVTMRVEFDLDVLNNSTGSPAWMARFSVGDFDGGSPGDNGPANRFASVSFTRSTEPSGTYRVRSDGTTLFPAEIDGFAHIVLVMNRSGAAQLYDAPDGTTRTLNNNAYSVFVNNQIAFSNFAASTASAELMDFKFSIWNNSADILIDNLVVGTDLSAIPEPASLTFVSAAALMLGRRRRRD